MVGGGGAGGDWDGETEWGVRGQGSLEEKLLQQVKVFACMQLYDEMILNTIYASGARASYKHDIDTKHTYTHSM